MCRQRHPGHHLVAGAVATAVGTAGHTEVDQGKDVSGGTSHRFTGVAQLQGQLGAVHGDGEGQGSCITVDS